MSGCWCLSGEHRAVGRGSPRRPRSLAGQLRRARDPPTCSVWRLPRFGSEGLSSLPSSGFGGPGGFVVHLSAPVTGLLSRRFWVDIRRPRGAPVREQGFCLHSTILLKGCIRAPAPQKGQVAEGVAGIHTPSREATHPTPELLLL